MTGTDPGGVPWVEAPTVELDLDLPPAARFVGVPDALVARSRELVAAVVAEVPEPLRSLADLARTRLPDATFAEARALAELLGVEWRDIVLANLSYDLAIAHLGCSTVAVATADGPVLARNMDWWPERALAQATCRLDYNRAGARRFAAAGWIGAIGVVTGMSARGFAIALNAVSSADALDPTGAPVLLLLRDLLADATGYDEAVDRLRATPLSVGGLFTVVGTQPEQRVTVERAPGRAALRRPVGTAPLIATNDYRALANPGGAGEGELARTACGRFDALTERMGVVAPGGAVADELLLDALCDPRIRMTITCQHVVMRPRTGELRVYVPRHLL